MGKLSDWKKLIARVDKIIVEITNADPDKLNQETRFVEDLKIDAHQSAVLRRRIAEEIGVEIPKDDAKELATLGDLLRYVQRKP